MKISYFVVFILFLFSKSFSQDHSEMIEGPFETPQEVTETCLTCHDTVGEEILQTSHWNWLNPESESEETIRGKRNMINNFCIAIPSNWPRCTSCHIGYGWEYNEFDFSVQENIDCLVCHEQTGTYIKSPTGAGYPDNTVDLTIVAQSVGLPTVQNCGNCHFNGGGGSGVKHGDMDAGLFEPDEEIDIHMGGMGFQCTECHVTSAHQISGGSHGSFVAGTNLIACENCHAEDPHEKDLLNRHYISVACETCHIPAFARTEPTLIWWDWSKAGDDREVTEDEFGKETYDKKKGEFKWAKDLAPEYFWFNGSAEYYAFGDVVEPADHVMLNKLNGDIKNPDAKISPFKVMKGRQPFDEVNNYLIIPKLYGENGYWETFDWNKASEEGMKAAGLEFSGSVGFVETEMFWPINHMVMSADNALKCTTCHGKGGKHLLDWKKLGYTDDPIKKGGREKNGYIKLN